MDEISLAVRLASRVGRLETLLQMVLERGEYPVPDWLRDAIKHALEDAPDAT